MTRFWKALALVGMSGYLLAPGACTMTGDGMSFLPYIGLGNLTQLLTT